MKYLLYWKEPEYARYLKYPMCLYFLDLLQYEHFRREVVSAQCTKFIDDQQILLWQHYTRRRTRLLQSQAEQVQNQTAANTNGQSQPQKTWLYWLILFVHLTVSVVWTIHLIYLNLITLKHCLSLHCWGQTFGKKWHALKALKSMKLLIYSVNYSAVLSDVVSHMKFELIDGYFVSWVTTYLYVNNFLTSERKIKWSKV